MNISNLQAFIEAVQTSSISKAADNLHLTQPAVSQQIQNLEASLGYQMLTRSNRGVQLTEYGKVFYAYAQSFLTLWDNLQLDLKTIETGKYVALQVGTCPAIGQYALPCTLYMFKQKFPQIQIYVQSLTTEAVIGELREHTIQVGFVEGIIKLPDLSSLVVLNSELILVAASTVPTQEVILAELSNLPLVLTSKNSDVRHSLKRNLACSQIDDSILKPFLELDSLESVKSAVISGHGLSFLPYMAIKKELYSGELKRIPIKDAGLEMTFSLVWRKDEDLSGYCKEFIDFINTEGGKSFC
jgi:LysR family transcriptional regulator, transcriptional activator of the cysJI operon